MKEEKGREEKRRKLVVVYYALLEWVHCLSSAAFRDHSCSLASFEVLDLTTSMNLAPSNI